MSNSRVIGFGIVLVSVLSCAERVCTAQVSPYSELIVFGDSMSETGNVHILSGGTAPPWPAYFEGRWSNGPVWVEYLADNLGVTRPGPSLDGGTNYAYAGAQTGAQITDSSVGVRVPGMGLQVRDYLDHHTPRGDELVVLLGGENDISFANERDSVKLVSNLATLVRQLDAAGVQHMLLVDPTFDNQNAVWSEFSRGLKDSVSSLDAELHSRIDYFDLGAPLREIYGNLRRYGLTGVFPSALDPTTGEIRRDPATQMCWDEPWCHVTTGVHRLLGEEVATFVVPEPSTLVAILALVPLVERRRRYLP